MMKLNDLKTLCKEHKIKGYSNKNKSELISIILAQQKQSTIEQNPPTIEQNPTTEQKPQQLNKNHQTIFQIDNK